MSNVSCIPEVVKYFKSRLLAWKTIDFRDLLFDHEIAGSDDRNESTPVRLLTIAKPCQMAGFFCLRESLSLLE